MSNQNQKLQRQRQEVVEDVPQYRSVMIGGPLSAPPAPRSFATMRPPLLKSAPPMPFKAMSAPSKNQRQQPSATAPVWNVTNDQLPSLPAAYFLERSNVYVVDATGQEIANRICEGLRLESIAATCDAEYQHRLMAETDDFVKFAVRLFSDQEQIVVEVQRRSGCSYQFREAAKAVLRSAKAVAGKAVSVPKRSFPLPTALPVFSAAEKEQRMVEGIQLSLAQIQASSYDSQRIGMEGLEQMTRSCTSASALLVLEAGNSAPILSAAQAEPSLVARSELQEQHLQLLKRRALTVLANVLAALANNKQDVYETSPDLITEALVLSLLTTLEQAETVCQHSASQAARCLQHLAQGNAQVQSWIQEQSTIVDMACTLGASRNVLLHQESRALLQVMGNC